MKKLILILIDGMRPDGLEQCGNKYLDEMKANGSYCMAATTVFPSVTLPCHFSLFHSVPPERHGITTNTYVPMARPLPGLFELMHDKKLKTGMFYNWEQLRDLSEPANLEVSYYSKKHDDSTDFEIAEMALSCIKKKGLDFAFVYFGNTDRNGHKFGWMSKNYLNAINNAISLVEKIVKEFPEYEFIITADHGGHERMHGCLIPEDMTIPMFFIGEDFKKNYTIEKASIMDIAPTILDLFDIEKDEEWEGESLLNKIFAK